MSAVLWAAVAWLIGALPTYELRRIVPRPIAEPLLILIDVARGAGCVMYAPGALVSQMLAASAVLAGYQWPPIGPKGREGLAVAAGAAFVLSPIALPAWVAVWALGYVLSGYPVAGRALACLAAPPIAGVFAGWLLGLAAYPLAFQVLERQRAAVRRMLLGSEVRHRWRPPS